MCKKYIPQFWEITGKHQQLNLKRLKKTKLLHYILISLVAQMVKRLLTMQETGVQSLGWEDLLEKEMATRSSILAWKIP